MTAPSVSHRYSCWKKKMFICKWRHFHYPLILRARFLDCDQFTQLKLKWLLFKHEAFNIAVGAGGVSSCRLPVSSLLYLCRASIIFSWLKTNDSAWRLIVSHLMSTTMLWMSFELKHAIFLWTALKFWLIRNWIRSTSAGCAECTGWNNFGACWLRTSHYGFLNLLLMALFHVFPWSY